MVDPPEGAGCPGSPASTRTSVAGGSAVDRAASATRRRARGAATAVAAALLLTAAGGTAGAQSTEYRVSIERGGTAAPRFSTPNRRSSYWLTINVSSADELECLSFKAANTATPRPRRFVGTTGARDAGTCHLPPRPGAERGRRDPERVNLTPRRTYSFYWSAPECSEANRARIRFNVMAEWRGPAGTPVRWANAEIDFSAAPSCSGSDTSGGGRGGGGGGGGGSGGNTGGGGSRGGETGLVRGGHRGTGLTASPNPAVAGTSVTVTAMLGDEHRAWGWVRTGGTPAAWGGESYIATEGSGGALAGRGTRLVLENNCPTHTGTGRNVQRIEPLLQTCTFTIPTHACRSGSAGNKCWPVRVILGTVTTGTNPPRFWRHQVCIQVQHPNNSNVLSEAPCVR